MYKNTWWAKADSSQQCPVTGHEANQNTWDSIWSQDGTRKHFVCYEGGQTLEGVVQEGFKDLKTHPIRHSLGQPALADWAWAEGILWLFWHGRAEQICFSDWSLEVLLYKLIWAVFAILKWGNIFKRMFILMCWYSVVIWLTVLLFLLHWWITAGVWKHPGNSDIIQDLP